MPEMDTDRGLDDPVISIGVLAEKVGFSVSVVRKYENEGLIIAHRTASGHRLFSLQDVDRVRNIQHMIQDLGLNTRGIHRLQALLPCWDLLPCTTQMREGCPAYKDNTQPCWMMKGLDCAPQGNECRRCAVYRFGSRCTEDIKRLLHDQNDIQDAGTAMKELIQRKRRSREEDG